MRYTKSIPVAAAVALAVTVGGCAAHHEEPASTQPIETSEKTVHDVIGTAAASLLDIEAMHVRFSSTDIPGLTASVYDAQVWAQPPRATGDATLLIDGQPVHAPFTVEDGKLKVGKTDGEPEDMGDAAGKLNPPALLNRESGLSSLVSSLRDMTEGDSSGIDARPELLRLEGKMPAQSAHLLLPDEVIGDTAEFPTVMWVDPANRGRLVQLLTTVGNGSVTLQLGDFQFAGVPPEGPPVQLNQGPPPPLDGPPQLGGPAPLPDGSPPPVDGPPAGAPPLPDGSPPPVGGPPVGAPKPPPGH